MSGETPPVEPYAYPKSPHQRRHGPVGYASYGEYLPWVKDEFSFRCVYCLKRIVWAPTDVWAIDHVIPKEVEPERICDYENLVLACQCCNRQKSSHRLADPCRVAYGSCLRVEANGEIKWLNPQGKRLVNTIRLNHPRYVEERRKWLRVLDLAARLDRDLFERLMGYPAELPDLSRLKPPEGNRRPDGVRDSFHSKKARGEALGIY
jgi:hypothetical protein